MFLSQERTLVHFPPFLLIILSFFTSDPCSSYSWTLLGSFSFSRSSCLNLQSAGITGLCCHGQLLYPLTFAANQVSGAKNKLLGRMGRQG